MIIKRFIEGKEHKIELTDQEVILASQEYDHSCYENDFISKLRERIASNFIDIEGDGIILSEKEALDTFGMSGAEISKDGCLKIINLEPFLSNENCEIISDFLEENK